jgi:hypothetical protein
LMVDNRSNVAIFLPGGTLLRGGFQDQVVANDLVVPPYTNNLPIATFCIDPFRSAERGNESTTNYSSNGSLFPWRLARLNLIDRPNEAGGKEVRQVGVWWSIDSLRSALSAQLGEAMEPAHTPTWEFSEQTVLGARQSSWTTGLVLALENPKLAKSLLPYLDLVATSRMKDEGIVGAAFVINGQVAGVEIYQTHQLFRALWPRLLRAYSIEAIALRDAAGVKSPTAEDISRLIAATSNLPANTVQPGFDVRESDAAVAAGLIDAQGAWVHRSFIPLPDPDLAATAPEALTLQMLRTGTVDGLLLADLDKKDEILIRRGDQHWSAKLVRAHQPETFSAGETEFNELFRRMMLHGADIVTQPSRARQAPGQDAVGPNIRERADTPADNNAHPDVSAQPGTEPVRNIPQNILSTREHSSDAVPVASLDPVLDFSLATPIIILLFWMLHLVSKAWRRVCRQAFVRLQASAIDWGKIAARPLPIRRGLSALPGRARDSLHPRSVRNRHFGLVFANAVQPLPR